MTVALEVEVTVRMADFGQIAENAAQGDVASVEAHVYARVAEDLGDTDFIGRGKRRQDDG